MESNPEPTGVKSAPIAAFEARLDFWIHHFRKDDRTGSIFGKTQPRGPLDARRRAFSEVLMPVNMDAMGIPKDGEDLARICTEIVDLLHKKSEDGLKTWLKGHKKPWKFTGYNDPRLIEISRIAELKLSEDLQSAESEM